MEVIMGKKVFTNRETEVAKLLCKGLSNPEIARKLIISNSTAKAHVISILHKLNVQNRTIAAYLMGKNNMFE